MHVDIPESVPRMHMHISTGKCVKTFFHMYLHTKTYPNMLFSGKCKVAQEKTESCMAARSPWLSKENSMFLR